MRDPRCAVRNARSAVRTSHRHPVLRTADRASRTARESRIADRARYTRAMRPAVVLVICLAAASCSKPPDQPRPGSPAARSLLLITIDTLRADRVGAYGYTAARTPAIDALAARGARFERAFSAAPITLTSHATIMTGRYPPGHGARHNGMRMDPAVPTLADTLSRQRFRDRPRSSPPFRSTAASA